MSETLSHMRHLTEHPKTFYRCPKCCGHLEKVYEDNTGRRDADLFWDCPVCHIRIKLWRYYPGTGKT